LEKAVAEATEATGAAKDAAGPGVRADWAGEASAVDEAVEDEAMVEEVAVAEVGNWDSQEVRHHQ